MYGCYSVFLMTTTSPPKATQRPVEDEPLAAELRGYDYADSFEIQLPEPDDHTAEEWMRCALENAPLATRLTISNAWRHALRFELAPESSPDHILGAEIVTSEPDLIHVAVGGPLLRGVLLGRRPDPTSVSVTTLLFYEQSRLAQAAWVVVGQAHRLIVPQLLEHAAARFGDEAA
jgi:hypothetical protein